MLVGTYKYGEHCYGVEAYDFDDSVVAYLTPHTSADKKFLDNGIHTGSSDMGAQWDKLYVSVGIGNVNASCFFLEEEDGEGNLVKYKNELNANVLRKFGAIIRGMKSSCNNTNKVIDGLYDTFSPSRILHYKFPSGTMSLEVRTIQSLEYQNGDVSLTLEEDFSYTQKIEKLTSVNHRFALDLSEFIAPTDDEDWDVGDEGIIYTLSEIIARHPDREYAWLDGRRYKVVTDVNEMVEICQKIWKHEGIVAFDTETTGLNVNVTSRQGIGDRLVGMVFSIEVGESWYFSIRHKKIQNLCTEAEEYAFITKYFKPILETKSLLCHNGAFDWKVMYCYDICINLVEDTYILFKVTMWNDHRDMSLSLKPLVKMILNRDSFELKDFVKGRFGDYVKFWDLDLESVKYYACPDTDSLYELWLYTVDTNLLDAYGAKKVYQIEVAFSLCIAYQEYYGHCVDITRIDDLVKSIKDTKETEYQKMVEIVGHTFNPRSTKDLTKVVFEELGYPVYGYTNTGNPSCDKKARAMMMEEVDIDGNPKYPLISHLHNYLESCTLESNFTKNISKFATEDGLMFSKVEQFLETGRVSVNNPNYQSYSDVVKKYIIPRAGYYALDADYSSVEARIMVSMAGCKDMIELMKNPDTDYHTMKASQMFGIPYELVTHKQRKMSKGVNFGILYGLGDPNLGAKLYGEKTPENTRKAKHQKELYFKGMEELRGFIEKSKAQGINQHYSTTYFGRRRYFDPRRVRKDTIERQSCNARIQGTAADIYKVAMVRLYQQLRKRGWLGKILISAFVHDECFLEISKSLDPMVVLGVLRKCMMLDNRGWCPLFIGAGFGECWYEAKNTEIPIQVQDSFVERFGETGLDWWDGNTRKLCDYVVDEINLYGRNRVIDYLKDENNRGKVLAPAINSLAHEVLDAINNGADIEGCVCRDVHSVSDVLDNLMEFGKAFDCIDLVEKADVRRPELSATQTQDEPDVDEEESYDTPAWKDLMLMYVDKIGCYYRNTSDGGELYFRYYDTATAFMQQLHNMMANRIGTTKVYAVKEDNSIYETGMFVDRLIYPELIKVYAVRKR